MFRQIQLDRKGEQHLYIQLYKQLKEMIEKGVLEENQQLPTIRKLAKQLEVNNVTIVNAYKLLEEEGLVIKKVGSGTYVTPLVQKIEREEMFVDDEIKLMNQGQLTVKKNMISFASATPDPDFFPIEDVKKAINHVLDRDGGKAFGYQDSLGYQPLRESFYHYLTRKKINSSVNNIQVVSGAQQGIDILAKALLSHGDVVFTEEPTYTGAISAFKSRGARMITIPIKEDGIDLDILKARLAEYRPKFLYIMTTYQNPTGYSYSMEKKQRLLELSKDNGFTIVEDDCLSELYYNDRYNFPLKSIQGAEDVIYIKSFSKIFLPGFRIGFMVIPDNIISQVMAAKHTSDISSSGLIQRTFDLLLRKGLWEKHIEEMRQIYLKKYRYFLKLLQQYLAPTIKYYIPDGGLNYWLTLPQKNSSNRLYKKCLQEGVIIVPGSVFYPDGLPVSSFRLSIAAVEEEDMKKGVLILSKCINELVEDDRQDETVHFIPLV